MYMYIDREAHLTCTYKGQPGIMILRNLLDLESSLLYTKFRFLLLFNPGVEVFQRVLPYVDMVTILVNGLEPFEQNFVPMFQRG